MADGGAGAAAGDAGDRRACVFSGSRARDLTLRAFYEGLAGSSYVEDQNVGIEYRLRLKTATSVSRNSRLSWCSAGVSLIAAIGSPAVAAAKASTTPIPIVFYVGVDPVSFGLVNRRGRPGGNLTGVTNFALETGPKRLELLADLLGSRNVVGILIKPGGSKIRSETELQDLLQATLAVGLRPHILCRARRN